MDYPNRAVHPSLADYRLLYPHGMLMFIDPEIQIEHYTGKCAGEFWIFPQ